VLVAVAACQPVPRPFQPEDKRLNAADFTRLGTRGGIIVKGADLHDPVLTERFAAMVAAALRDAGVPALSGQENASSRYVLAGTLNDDALSSREAALSGVWRLTDPLGNDVMSFRVREGVDVNRWWAGDPAATSLVAERIAKEVAQRLAGNKPAVEVAAIPDDIRLTVWSIDGLDDGQEPVLASALRAALRVRGIPIASPSDPGALVVAGWVERAPGASGMERIAIEWSLLEPNGREVGMVSQSNEVPLDSFEATFNEAAPAIAGAAADGLVDMLRKRPQRATNESS